MDITVVAAGSVLLAVMLGILVYAAVTLPTGAQVPVHHGLNGYNNWQPKRVAVALWSGIAVAIYAIILATARTADPHGRLTPTVILPAVQLVLIFNQLGAIRAARSRSGSGPGKH